MGGAIGAVVGAIVYPWIDEPAKTTLLERGEAFDYLYGHRNKKPCVANARLVGEALDSDIPAFDKNGDGRKWYAIEDLDKFLESC